MKKPQLITKKSKNLNLVLFINIKNILISKNKITNNKTKTIHEIVYFKYI